MKNRYATTICLLAASACLLFYSFKTSTSVVKIESGVISGVESGGVVSYKGVPFAAPPVGDLRWKAPTPAKHWQGVKACNNFGPSPMQPKPVPFMVYTSEFLIPEKPISEDCLYLNVWAKKTAVKKPVFVWIYGGGFSSGGTGVPIYDGAAMAKKGIVFVSVNYRVGVFGFLAHPELTKESPNNASGNYGLLDQIAALKWIKRNIAAFGGDADNVTIGGQSAGSMSVNSLVASPLAKGLFTKAIAESGSLMVGGMYSAATLAVAEEQGEKLAKTIGASSLKELRDMDAATLMKVPARYVPIVDGYVIPKPIPTIIGNGEGNKISLLIGWNADEAFVFSFKNKEQFTAMAKEKYGKDADEFLKYYPAATDEEAARSQIKLGRDLTFSVSGYKWAGLQSSLGATYVYYFSRKLPATPDFVKYGAFHTGEVAYALSNLKFLHRPWHPADFKLADVMNNYWVNFIKTGNPNGKDLTTWPKYNKQTSQAMVLDTLYGKQPLPGKDELAFMLSLTDK